MRKNSSTSSFNFLTAIGVFLVCFLFGELVFRITSIDKDAVLHFLKFSPQELFYTNLVEGNADPQLGYSLKKQIKGFYKGKQFSTDEWGGRLVPSIPPEGNAARDVILILGRSIDMGEGVSDSESWPSIFAENLNSKALRFRVNNWSTSGYNWVQIRKLAESKMQILKPKVVILPIYLKEWSVPFNKAPSELPIADFRNHFLADAAFNHFYIYQLSRFLFKSLTVNLIASDWDYRALGEMDRNKYSTLAIELPKIVLPLLDQGIRVVIAVHPNLLQSEGPQEIEVHQILNQWAAGKSGLQVIEISRQDLPDHLYEPIYWGNPHPNSKYHKFFGNRIAENIFLGDH